MSRTTPSVALRRSRIVEFVKAVPGATKPEISDALSPHQGVRSIENDLATMVAGKVIVVRYGRRGKAQYYAPEASADTDIPDFIAARASVLRDLCKVFKNDVARGIYDTKVSSESDRQRIRSACAAVLDDLEELAKCREGTPK